MRRTAIFLAVVFFTNPANAQWKKIADFGSAVTCVYFIDLPGAPRIGFAGTESELYKTTNGGQSWSMVWGHGNFALYQVTDICFKDSLTGWFTMFGDTDACYRTTDGGNYWNEIYSSPFGAQGVAYNARFNRLFLSLSNYTPTSTLTSPDLGDTWQIVSDSQTIDPTFLSDSIGLASYVASSSDTSYGFMRTIDGGFTWTLIKTPFLSEQPLGIPYTPICFAASNSEITVWRSDDYGLTWRKLYDFGPFSDSNGNLIGPIGTGYIKGDLSRLYIQSDSGMYVSVDSGITWKKDGGPSGESDPQSLFFSAKGLTMAGNTYNGGGVEVDDGLWEEDTGAVAGVAESGAANSSTALSVFPNPATNSITIQSANGPVTILDPLGRSYTTPQPPPWEGGGVTIDVSSLPSGVYFISDGASRAKFVKE